MFFFLTDLPKTFSFIEPSANSHTWETEEELQLRSLNKIKSQRRPQTYNGLRRRRKKPFCPGPQMKCADWNIQIKAPFCQTIYSVPTKLLKIKIGAGQVQGSISAAVCKSRLYFIFS